MSAAHTPGPCRCQRLGDFDGKNHHPLCDGAPDLLSAAEKARRALSDLLMTRDPVVYADALRDLDSAIAKARGEQ